MRPAASRVIGVDVGGTKVAAAALHDGVLGEPRTEPTVTASPAALVDQLEAAIRALMPADAVGIGVPSIVDFAAGTATASVNIPLAGVPLRRVLYRRLGVPVFVDNDATVAALAEAHDGDGRLAAQSLVMLTLGTGVGGGIVLGGRVYRGATGAAAELGHQIVAMDVRDGAPEANGFPQAASLERHASGRALDALAAARGLGDGRGAVAAARHGEPAGLEAVRILGERLGIGIANVINTFDPEVVVVGGGVSAAGDLLLDPARAVAARFTVPGAGRRTEIRIARHGNEAGVRGAALLARTELAGVAP